jgi:hypothetical protein
VDDDDDDDDDNDNYSVFLHVCTFLSHGKERTYSQSSPFVCHVEMFYCAITQQLEIKFFLLLMEDILVFLYSLTRHGGMANWDIAELHSSCVKNSL